MKTNQLRAGDFVTPTVRLLRPLAEGGMGRVWVAEHQGLQTQVVVKLMAPEMAERSDGAERFAREAAVAAAIKTPHVAQVFDHGVTADGTPYIVMELLEGRDLGAHLALHGRMAPSDVITLVTHVSRALAKAHKASIIHRDIKPENIFLCDTDGGEIFVKLLDFGTARRESETHARTTVPGLIMGTPHYMSPEQSVGAHDLDERSDIWSLGVVVFEALTGKKPFDGSSLGAITIAIHGPLPRITDEAPDLPRTLDAWFARCCALEPEERFATVREAASGLVEAVTGAPLSEPLTESINFPTAAATWRPRKEEPCPTQSATTSTAPVTRPSLPLSSTLPARGRNYTTVAAGIVMALAAIAMGTIVLGRPVERPVESSPDSRQVVAKPPEATSPVPPPATPEPQETNDAPVASSAEEPAAPPPRPAPVAAPQRRDTRTRVSAPRGQDRPRSVTEGLDDDLVRLTNAASKQADEVASPPQQPAAPPLPAPLQQPAPAQKPAPPLPAPPREPLPLQEPPPLPPSE